MRSCMERVVAEIGRSRITALEDDYRRELHVVFYVLK